MCTQKHIWCGLLLNALLLGDALAQLAPVPQVLLIPDDRPAVLNRYEPAGEPLQRYTARPGAWYVALYLAAPPQWPVEFMVTSLDSRHDLRVFALDTTNMGEVSNVVVLPMTASRARRGQMNYVGEFVLPAHASMDGITLLLEQWSPSGEAPPAIQVNARLASAPPSISNGTAWWSTRPVRPANAHTGSAVAPLSPLQSDAARRGAYEIPFRQMPASPPPVFEPFSNR